MGERVGVVRAGYEVAMYRGSICNIVTIGCLCMRHGAIGGICLSVTRDRGRL